MFVALNEDGKRVLADDADKSRIYKCPVCNEVVTPHQGDIVAWHFAHKVRCSDTWHYDMSDWHRRWQSKFPEECREVVMTDESGRMHRADVCIGNHVIEFQHSQISYSELNERNEFYTKLGYKVLWVFDFYDLKFDGTIFEYDRFTWCWSHPWQSLSCISPQDDRDDIAVIFDVSNIELFGENSNYLVLVDWASDNWGRGPISYKRFKGYPIKDLDLTNTANLNTCHISHRDRWRRKSQWVTYNGIKRA